MRLFLTTVFLLFISESLEAHSHPNVILVLSSDVPRDELGSYGTDTQTPNLARLQKQGTRYQIAWAMPTFHLSQRALLSGKYPTTGNSPTEASTSILVEPEKTRSPDITVATILRKTGYLTLAAGKWATDGLTPVQESLIANGFDQHCILESSLRNQKGPQTIVVNGRERSVENAGKAINAFLIDFLSTPLDKPFFLYYPMLSPRPVTLDDETHQQSTSPISRAGDVDQFLGDLLDSLEESGQTENTLLVFTSIHGLATKTTSPPAKDLADRNPATNSKVLVPFIVQAPFLSEGGHVTRDLIDFTDLAPTILELTSNTNLDNHQLDGRTFVPSLKGVEDPFEKRNWIYARAGNVHMIRDWQHFLDSDGNFHDLIKDPFQRESVSPLDKQAPGRKQRLELILQRLESKLTIPNSK